jgi:DNA-binding MarR family transcriptional regulator
MDTLTETQSRLMEAIAAAGGMDRQDLASTSKLGGAALETALKALKTRGLIAIDGAQITAVKARAPRATKQDELIALLGCKTGHYVDDLSRALGWQPHTTRAALTRLRQSGHRLEKLQPAEGERRARYRLAGEASS